MTLHEQLDKLARFGPVPYPVVSLYLNSQPDEHGRDAFQTFVRKELPARANTYPAGTPDRESLDRDLERISQYLENTLQASANGVALFACSAGELFEAIQLDAPVDANALVIGDQPHLYPLARIASQYPRYAAVLADTHTARILVIAQGAVERAEQVEGVKTRRTSQGGWSQARYQRHIANYHLQHVKEVIEALDRIVRRDAVEQILFAGDPVVLPLFREQLPKHLADKVVEEITLATDAPAAEVIARSLETLRQWNERSDRERVETAIGAYRAGALGVMGPDETLLALTNGQVDELLITASLARLQDLQGTHAAEMAAANDSAVAEPAVDLSTAGEPADAGAGRVRLADELVARANRTGARITFIEDPQLLEPYGGVAALLRYRV